MFLTSIVPLLLCLLSKATKPCSVLAPTLITQFEEYNQILHYNNSTRHCSDTYNNHSRTLINYDVGTLNIKQTIPRGNLHILLLSGEKLLKEFLKNNDVIGLRDVIVMVVERKTGNMNLTSLCVSEIRIMRKARGVFVLYDNSMYYCNFYYGKYIAKVEEVTVEEGNLPDMTRMLNDFKDMGGFKFIIGYSNFPPALYTKEVNGKNKVVGIEHTILELFAEKINFTYDYKEFSMNNSRIGVRQQQINEVIMNKIDWIMGGVTLTYERSLILDYMNPIEKTEYAVVFFVNCNFHNNLNIFMKNLFFKNTYLLLMLSSILLVAMLIEISEFGGGREIRHFLSYMKMNVLVLIDQSLPSSLIRNIAKWRTITKLLILTWWFVSWINSTYLKSGLSASLMRMRSFDISDEHDLMERGYKFEAEIEDYLFLYNWCRYSSFTSCYRMIEDIEITDDVYESLKKAEIEKIAMVKEHLPLEYFLQYHLVTHTGIELATRKIGIGNGVVTWFFPQSTPYIEAFNSLLCRLKQNGILKYWYENKDHFNQKKEKIFQPSPFLKMEHLSNTFVLLLCGLGFSFAVFLIEILTKKMKK